MYFDLENESLETLPMPISTMEAPMERNYFSECRGILYVAVTYFIVVCLEFNVSEMASDYSLVPEALSVYWGFSEGFS